MTLAWSLTTKTVQLPRLLYEGHELGLLSLALPKLVFLEMEVR